MEKRSCIRGNDCSFNPALWSNSPCDVFQAKKQFIYLALPRAGGRYRGFFFFPAGANLLCYGAKYSTNPESFHLICTHVVGWCVDEIKIQVISIGQVWKMRLSIFERSVEQFHRVPQTMHHECKLHGQASCTDGMCKLSQASSCFPIHHLKRNLSLSLSLIVWVSFLVCPIFSLPVIILCVTQSISLCQQRSTSACTTKI